MHLIRWRSVQPACSQTMGLEPWGLPANSSHHAWASRKLDLHTLIAHYLALNMAIASDCSTALGIQQNGQRSP